VRIHRTVVLGALISVVATSGSGSSVGYGKVAVDPGVRGGPAGAGGPLLGLTTDETAFFQDGASRFAQVEVVTGGANHGLGPRFNGNQCLQCHAQPAIGGTSPRKNPQIELATLNGATNKIPWFTTENGPIREARFKKNPDGSVDGGVHAIFVITGRNDAKGCNIAQPIFTPAGNPSTGRGGNSNLAFRIATPLFGIGLIEAIPDAAILANSQETAAQKRSMGISGHPNAHISGVANRSANDGTITRFGWKAQNKSLLIFAGEAYNVEMGITNEMFPQERDYTAGCIYNATPEDTLNFTPPASGNAQPPYTAVVSDIEAFADFMRMLAPPQPAADTPSTVRGRALFVSTGCALCHTPSMRTAKAIASGSSTSPSAALSDQVVNLYSDLLVHHMGKGLADGISQGGAGSDEFRTAPLWGVGQRIHFLHDGRTTDLMEAIRAHRSFRSEANRVVVKFRRLGVEEQQDILNFLRNL
jgi:CxxC motif-containing protein (DUF1111 family)